ncbi:MAG: Gfo/Idh/MocA family oxidoreductase [Vicinamibacterales bacterium]
MNTHRPIDKPLRIAFIGAGQMARNHLAAIQRLSVPATIVGVTDRVPTAADQFASLAGVRPSFSTETLLADTQPDIVHVCTPPSAHFEAAHAALDCGAHVYVEKPFALTSDDASGLIALAAARRRLICAGHQLVRDAAFETLMARLPELGTIVQVDSHFSFRPVGAAASRGEIRALGEQTIDILPHPLYTLTHVLESCNPSGTPVDIAWAKASAADLHAILQAGDVVGRLSVSLRSRPVASYLTITGTRGSLTCDFVRSIVTGAANTGTQPLEKILNPIVEGSQLASRTVLSLGRRLCSGGSYPGLASLIEAFYRAVARNGSSPVTPEHLLRVTAIFEQLVDRIEAAAYGPPVSRPRPHRVSVPPRIALTGASGFLGAEIARALQRVRGIGRGPNPDRSHDWVVADLGTGLSPEALAGVDTVVHAAAETAGGFEAHRRNTIDATRHLLRAMRAAGVSRLVLVSSLSVLRPPRTPWERQDESTPRAQDPRRYGPYTWGKSIQEEIVERDAPGMGITTRIVRPGALLDWNDLPGLMGRHLYGRWHLGLGRPSLPIAVCDVARCADAIAWCATHFDEAPPVVNLMDPALLTRRQVAMEMRRRGWRGRIVWIPISLLSFAITSARTLASVSRGQWPEKFSPWAVLKPRRFDPRRATTLLDAASSSDADRIALGA